MKIYSAIFFGSLILVGIFFNVSFLSGSQNSLIHLSEGKNNFSFNQETMFYVKDLIKLNPEIEVVSYTLNDKSIGYINLFNGLGENFIIIPNRTYEIITKKNITLILP